MLTLTRYIGISIIKGYLLVLLILLALFAFLDFVDQLEDLGKGDYRLADIGLYILRMLPRYSLELAPVTVLLGGTLALGGLANRSELVVMRAAGVSVGQIGWAVMKTGILVMLAVIVVEEYIAPPLHQSAHKQRLQAISQTLYQRSDEGFWSRDGLRFINVGNLLHGRIPSDINIYEFDESGRLLLFIHADSAADLNQEQWLLEGVREKVYDGEKLVTLQVANRPWEAFLTARQLRILEPPMASLALSDLYRFIRYLRRTRQRSERYELALWEKLTLPFTTGVMALMSIPFVFGLPRIANSGQRVLLGALIGIGFYLFNQIVANLGLMLQLSPAITSIIPVLVILGFASLLLRRVR